MQFSATFKSVGNPDYGQTEAQSPEERATGGLVELSRAARSYVERHNLGAGNWPRTVVTDPAGQEIAVISYNGRLWGVGEEPGRGEIVTA